MEVSDPRSPAASCSSNMGEARPVDNTTNDFRSLLDRRGLLVEEADSYRVLGELHVADDLHAQCIRSSDNAVRFVSQAFARLWNGGDKFEDSKAQLDLLLGNVHPSALPLPVGHVSLDQLPKLAIAATAWGIHVGPLMDAIDFYLSRAVEVPASQKLSVASITGSDLLLESTLHNDCGKAEAISEITDSVPILDNISNSAKGNVVMKRMLQHSSKCTDSTYLAQMEREYTRLLALCRSRLRSYSDFRPTEAPCGGGEENSSNRNADQELADIDTPSSSGQAPQDPLDCTQLVNLNVEGRIFTCSRPLLALYSPVLRRMLYGSFQEGRSMTMPFGEESPVRAVHLFLALLQPTGVNALWWLCPKEIAQLDWMDKHPIVDELFDLIFEQSIDLVMQVFELAHKFQVTKLVRFCELMIDNKSQIGIGEKIRLADLYHLPDLMARCLARMRTPAQFRADVYSDPGLINELGVNTVKLLMERLLQLF